ncbi:substrate-binding domain-containing protein [Granulicella sp. 5B5]|uniref:LacI family DNA-binding transcriptional regulator n=1 Tax=Granulicella sp. 5B5 TaxID=1617967 RepID=UPI0015F6C0F7|nr:LacI family DNA-binding transcriptional regulator [Granulicella sp. 5B5]QMV18352.1 substrate-binding domain-containing protein [Granulicella sp. 5B5]
MAAKMKDIARALGVSLVTVSKALRGHPDISRATRERVEAKVKELNYRPNLAARSLVTGRSSLVGLIVPDLLHPFFADIARGLSLALREHGYFLVLCSSEEDPTLEQQEIEHVLAHRLDALVVASCQPDSGMLAQTQSGDTPLILVDRSFPGFSSHFVGADDYTAGKLAAEHLLAIGCKRIAHIRGTQNSAGARRYKGFADTLQKHNRPLRPEYLVAALSADVGGKTHGIAAFNQLWDLPHPPDGIFCFNDVIAIGVETAAAERGVRIPDQVALIGCGNLHYDDAIRVPLSSIDQRSSEIGTRVAKLILEIVADNASPEHRRITLQPKLVERASTTLSTHKAPATRRKPSKQSHKPPKSKNIFSGTAF